MAIEEGFSFRLQKYDYFSFSQAFVPKSSITLDFCEMNYLRNLRTFAPAKGYTKEKTENNNII